jgi:tetratricopeptide (TPR) repeat protein
VNPLLGIDPHPCFREFLHCTSEQTHDRDHETRDSALTAPRRHTTYHNSLLSELAVDGEWPSQICQVPYLMLLARSILLTLSNPTRSDWTYSFGAELAPRLLVVPESFATATLPLTAVHVWSARAVVAHQRLLPSLRGDPSVTLWDEATATFHKALAIFCDHVHTSSMDNFDERMRAATVVLEWGLAQHHFSRVPESKRAFQRAMEFSSVHVELTGAEGKRTKFQQEATAQMLVRAVSIAKPTKAITDLEQEKIRGQLVEHSEEEILLERIKYTNDEENEIQQLSILDQAILLSLCLDVKNNNPADGLTGEQMGAYLARVLDHHDDWMVYSTGLLERSWLEFERSHGRERAILQIQALSDQHTNRLTITQSTFQSVEESAPVQDRLRNLHIIVYPPRWSMLADLAERYANMGIVTSAAEIFADVEMWDEVVVCYTRAGKSSKAEQIVRERLAVMETPRMWAALGDITNDPEHYEKALELSKGRFSAAHVALGKYYFDKGEIVKAGGYLRDAVKIRPLLPQVWFRLGTISMQLKDWPKALSAFTEVVQQEPEESEAWANVAAVHMHNKNPIEAYPALNESLKNNRNNWRVWVSKLYVSIDLKKYDEAIQACNTLLDFKAKSNYAEKVPDLEEKCIRAIVGASLKKFQDSSNDAVALDSTRRTLSRLHDLLDRMSSSTKAEPWVWEIFAVFNEAVGRDEEVLENLMKEYRSLQSYKGWETDQFQVLKVIQVVAHISHFHITDGTKDSLVKCRFLVRGVINKIKPAYMDLTKIPVELEKIETILAEVEKKLESMK